MRMHALAVFTILLTSTGCAPKPNTSRAEGSPSAASGEEAKAEPTVKTEELTYKAGELELKGYLAVPAKLQGKAPGVLVVHEWWGLNEYVRSRARMLAELGYVALAVDMYGGGKNTEHPADAKKFATEATQNPADAARRFDAARELLAGRTEVDATKLAAIGYCFGGAVVLGAARRGVDLDLVASFHGSYGTSTPMAKGAFPGRLFIAHGGADTFVPAEQLAALKQELDAASARYEVVVYEGAKHGFTNPNASAGGQKNGLDIAYDQAADAQSWNKLTELLSAAFSGA